MRISTFSPDMRAFIAQKLGKLSTRVPGLVYLPFLLHFAPFSYHFICFFASNCLQISLFTDLLEGVPSYNPPVRKSAFLAFDHFLIQPPPSLQHCSNQPAWAKTELLCGRVVHTPSGARAVSRIKAASLMITR